MSYQTLFENALSLHEAGQLDEAEKVYRQILETAPNQPDVLNLLGLVAQAKGLQDEAISLFVRAITEKPNEVSFRYNLAFSYKLAKRFREALDAFLNVLRFNPTIKEAHNEIGLLHQKLEDYEQAAKSFDYALELDPQYAEARINKAMNLRYNNVRLAIEALEKLVPIYENEALLWFYLAQLYMASKNWQKAWSCAARTKELAPTSDDVRVMLGELSLLEDDVVKAKIYFAKAELLNPDNTITLLHLANIYSKEEDFAEAEARYKRVLELEPKNFEAHQNYAEMLYRAKRTSEALEEYRQAVIVNPDSAEVCNNLALILKDEGDFGQATDLLLNAYRLKPELAEISVNLNEAIILLAAQDAETAKKAINRWLELDKNNIFAQKLKATIEGESFENNHLYSERLFDHFADNYELVMQNLGYSAQMAVGRIVRHGQGRIVDLGCGTGLLAQTLKDVSHYLIGVDISQKMLDKAAEKKIYDELVKDDIVHFLEVREDFDLAILSDVCGYTNDMSAIIKLLKNKKIFLTIEATDKYPIEVGASGRYCHNPDYIETLLRENAFKDIYKEELILRQEAGKNVKGVVFFAEYEKTA